MGHNITVRDDGVKVIQLDEDCDLPALPEGCTELVYLYTAGSYEGNGTAYTKGPDCFYIADLGHCSCYGPGEADWSKLDEGDLAMHLLGDTQGFKAAAVQFGWVTA